MISTLEEIEQVTASRFVGLEVEGDEAGEIGERRRDGAAEVVAGEGGEGVIEVVVTEVKEAELVEGCEGVNGAAEVVEGVDNGSDVSLVTRTWMSCPHVSGLTELLKAWSPAAIQSALDHRLHNRRERPPHDRRIHGQKVHTIRSWSRAH
ncbi:subtilase family protein [Striga asiatica]|uniref:Subtilase family protein n=1 Tax=Striga asiatica TaxID=4170 RepID=A0A5A7P2R8_STRAF|nr:subtilase family protein [Striga asiatica]